MRELRRYEHMAQKDHWCDTCCDWIFPGQLYEGLVYADNLHGIVVLKCHIDPRCEPPPDPEEEVVISNRALEAMVRVAA